MKKNDKKEKIFELLSFFYIKAYQHSFQLLGGYIFAIKRPKSLNSD